MAINEVSPGIRRKLAVASGVVTGDPVLIGAALVGVAETTRDADGNAIVSIAPGRVWNLSVKGINAGGNSAVAVGDKLYITMAHTPHIDKDATAGVLFGKALATVGSGSTATIEVEIIQA